MRRALAALAAASVALPAAGAGARLGPAKSSRVVEAVARVARGPADVARFAVIEDLASGRWVQFANNGDLLEFDVPVLGARIANAPSPLKDTRCSNQQIRAQPGEVETRHLSREEEQRLVQAIRAMKLPWGRRWCVSVTREGTRAGYVMSVVGPLGRPEDAVAFIERIFGSVFGQAAIGPLKIATDE